MPAMVELPELVIDGNGTFPHDLYVLRGPNDSYACYYFSHDNVHGLSVFSTEALALRYNDMVPHQFGRMEPLQTTFDEAVGIATTRPVKLQAIFLMDGDFNDPTATYWL